MWNKIVDFFKAPIFPGDEEKTRQARALQALHINMGAAILILGFLGVVFVFKEKAITSLILLIALIIVFTGMILNRRGHVRVDGILMMAALWTTAVLMTSLSGGIRSLDIIFFVSGTVIAGIILGAKGALHFAILSLMTGLGLIVAESAGVVFPHVFTFPPVSVWVILFINLVFTVVPMRVALQSLSDSASRAHR